MTSSVATSNIYGHLPLDLVASPKKAQQFSPLIPGSAILEACPDESLSDLTMVASFNTLERRYSLAHALRVLCKGGHLTVMAPNDKGGKRLKKELQGFGCDVAEDARRHYRVCECEPPSNISGYSEAKEGGDISYLKEIGFWSQPGLFSWNRIDPGSALLAMHLPVLEGRGADLGCGFGYLARKVLTSSSVKHLTLIDIDRRAIECATKNIDDPRVSLHWKDISDTPATLKGLDFVVMNPPFHEGGREDRLLGQRFIERAASLLRAGGTCWVTANRHLPYEEVLSASFKNVSLKGEAEGYKIYEASI